MGIIIAVHGIVCALLITIILVQRGRGGGLAESFSGVESMFGTKTSAFLTRTTTVLSIMFFATCLSLAFFSARQSRSLLKDIKIPETKLKEQLPIPQAEAPQPETAAKSQDSMFRKPAQAKVTQEAPKTNK